MKQLKDTQKFDVLAEALRSLGHPERVAILDLICSSKEKRLTVKNIYEALEMEQPVVSRHLGILKRCGILERKIEDAQTYYCLCRNNKMAEQIYKCVCDK